MDLYDDETVDAQALGWVPVDGRASLPFALVHGESLVAAASWAVGEAGVQLFDSSVPFSAVRESGRALLLHDPLCPLTPADFLATAVRRCQETDQVVVGYRPVTDTIKTVSEDLLGTTVDRDGLRAVTSPVVIPARVLADLEALDASDFPALVAALASAQEIDWIQAPSIGRRISSAEDLVVLEALSRSMA